MNKKIIYFEVRIGSMSENFDTEKEAMRKLNDMKKGYPDNKFMSEDNRTYWKNASKKSEIYQITKTIKKIK